VPLSLNRLFSADGNYSTWQNDNNTIWPSHHLDSCCKYNKCTSAFISFENSTTALYVSFIIVSEQTVL